MTYRQKLSALLIIAISLAILSTKLLAETYELSEHIKQTTQSNTQ